MRKFVPAVKVMCNVGGKTATGTHFCWRLINTYVGDSLRDHTYIMSLLRGKGGGHQPNYDELIKLVE